MLASCCTGWNMTWARNSNGSPPSITTPSIPTFTSPFNTVSHLDIAHYFGRKLAERKRGGLILVGAMGAENGVPHMANDGAAKAYVHTLGEALHYEFKPLGVYVTVLAAGFTNTAVLEKFGLDPKTMPMKPMSVEQCVS